MIFINLSLAISILSKITKEKIIVTEHTKKRLSQRSIDEKTIYDCLINLEPKGIVDQKDSLISDHKYKILYEHPERQDYDMILIVVIDETKNNIRIITTYIQDKERRVR